MAEPAGAHQAKPASVPPGDSPDDGQRNLPSGTYVVRVPKDQIYRVPPSLNGRIVEQHKNRKPPGKGSGCCKCILCLILLMVIIFFLIGVIIGVSVVVAKPKNPRFQVDHLNITNSTKALTYNLKLVSHNPNSKTGILYKEGGTTSLNLKDEATADGKFPALYQEKDTTKDIALVLKGSKSSLPEEITNSLKSTKTKVHVSFELKINVPATMKFGIFFEHTVDIIGTCNFTVDTLAQGTRVISQSCNTTQHLQSTP